MRCQKMSGYKCMVTLSVVIILCFMGVNGECNINPAATLSYEIDEGLKAGTVVATIPNDLPPHLGPSYKPSLFLDNVIKTTFDIDYNNGVIKTKIVLDRETKSSYMFDIEKGTSSICINVTVLDINEFAPEFSTQFKKLQIYEGAPHRPASTLGSVIDRDYGENSIKGFRLASGNVDYAFNVTGKMAGSQKLLLDLNVNGTLDYETTTHYTLTVEVYDGGTPSLTATMQVEIDILDTNDNHPIFNQSKYSAAVLENTTVGASILEVHATDQDSGVNGKVSYSIDRQSDPDEIFVIDPESGIIRLNKPLDYESIRSYKIFAIASDGGQPSNSFSAFIEIEVLNINEIPANIYITYLVPGNTPRIPENASVGFVVARVSVSDPEAQEPDSASISVTLQGGEGHFRLEETGVGTFLLKVNSALDRETKPIYNLTLIAADSGSPPLSASKSFTLQLEDINDHAPVFDKSIFEAFVDEMSEPGSLVMSETASDKDIGENARITYTIKSIPGGNSDWFHVDSKSGLVTTRGQVDCEVNSHPSFWLVATDNGIPALSSSASVVVSVSDVNDKEPTFDQSLYQGSVPEDQQVGSCILQVNATDPDCGVNGQIRYSVISSEVSDWFKVEPLSGRICINRALDYETHSIYQFAVVAQDSGNFTTTANVEIGIQDINDNVPIFYPRNYSMNIQDSSQPGSTVITVQATDEDSGEYGDVSYSIVSGNSDLKFKIDPTSGTITVANSLPSGERVYRLVIDAVDGGRQTAEQRAEVYISVTGPDSNPPTFERRVYRFEVSEDAIENAVVGAVRATYAGSSENISYTISAGDRNSFFKIESESGVIRTARRLDHDQYPFLILGITASIGRTPLFGFTQVNITVKDINDNAPHFSRTHVTASVSEGADSSVTIYSAYASDSDSRENGVVRYSLVFASNIFTIDAISGEIHLSATAKLDYEHATRHELLIEARDQGVPVQSSTMTLVINVQDANDNSPLFQNKDIVLMISEKASINDKIGKIVATDEDSGENGRVSFSLIDSSMFSTFGIFPSDGILYLRNVLDRESVDKYTFRVRARDHGQPSLSATATVTVYVEDYNDNAPTFSESNYHFYIEENQPSQKFVGSVRATDADTGNNAVLQYDINPANNDFDISNDGTIHTKRSLDRELHPEYNVEVTVRDLGNPPLEATVSVLITVTDVNDHSPVIQNTQFTEQVEENKSKGVRIVQIEAKDPDAGDNGTISFSLAQDKDPIALKYFAIHPSSGWITTKEVLDYEERHSYSFQVVATDAGSPPLSTQKRFEINVKDMNDEGPVFTQSANETFYVVENTPVGTTVGVVEAYDRDGGENGRVSYYVIGGNRFGLFSVAMETGVITTIRDIDYEEYSSDDVTIKAIDNSVYNPKSSIITIKIHVIDINDNAPIFEKDPVFLTVRENIPVTTVLHKFTATDADSGVNGTIVYQIMKASVDGKFEIDSTDGKLSVSSLIDYEEVQSIDLVIKAIDQAPTSNSRLFTTVTVYILVKDENDNAPVFHSYQPIYLREDEPVGYRIMSIIADDADSNVNNSGNDNVTYSITSGNANNTFGINPLSGVLSITSPLDRETTSSFTLMIKARDHGTPRLESSLAFVVHITDVNDNAPKFLQSVYQANITEHSLVGTPVTKVSAIDDDDAENGQLTYKISDGISKDLFSIDPVTGLITLETDDLDREKSSSHSLTVYVQDSGSPKLYDTAIVVINVTDINDSAPKFKDSLYLASIPENQTQEDIHTFVAYDADVGDNARVRYSISDGMYRNRFAINPETGVLTTREALDREAVPYYVLTIRATDGVYSETCQINITVIDENDNNPVFEKNKYEKLLYENAKLGTTVVTVKATDMDEGDNGLVSYSLHNDSDASLFEIDPVCGTIATKGVFDREKKSKYTFDAIACDEGLYNRRSSMVKVEVTIGDINDNAPIFQEMPYKRNVGQGLSAGTPVLTVHADDKDAGVNGEVTYKLSSQSDALSTKYFAIDSISGEISTKLTLGTEAIGYHNLKVVATDKAQEPISSTGVVEITVGSAGGSMLQFQNQNYSTSLYENAEVGSRVITVQLENQPSGVIFSFASGNDLDAFDIDPSGLITVKNSEPIDYEAYTYMRLIVSAASGDIYAYTTVWVNLINVNDNPPKFSQDKYVTKVDEGQPRGTYVMQVRATDADGPNSDIIYYNIIQGNTDKVFTIDPAYSGIITTSTMLDYEIRKTYRLTIEAKDNGRNKTLSSTCIVKISVIDINDNPPKLPDPKPVFISEDTEVGTVVTMVTANDIDVGPPVMYNFSTDGNPDRMFSIDHYSGMIRLSKPLDYEKRQHYIVGIQASDTKYVRNTNLDIFILDENDHSPTFSQQSYQVSLAELTPADVSVIKVNATDKDAGENAHITYSLTSSLIDGFYINEQTGVIYTKETVVYQPNQEIIQLVVMATDNGSVPLSAVVAVYIQISSVNNYAPEFVKDSYVASVSEDTKRGFVVLHVEADDRDTAGQNKEIDYRIINGNIDNMFIIDQKGGKIMLNGILDRESELGSEYNLIVMAKDRGLKPKNSTVNVQIIVQDVNDRIPYFEPGNCLHGEYCKVLNESFPDDVAFMKVSAFDEDIGANSKIYYSFTSGNDEGLFIINGNTGELFITPNETLDYERHAYHKLVVKATDCSGCPAKSPKYSNFTTVHINITDVNEFAPEFPVMSYFENVKENMPIGSSVFRVHANDKDGGVFGQVNYVLIGSSDFSLLQSGYVTTNQIFEYESDEPKEFQFQVTATDRGGKSTTVSVFLRLEDVDDFDPKFLRNDYAFEIPGRAKKGAFIGQVKAVDDDAGSAGKIVYQLIPPHKYFGINASTGVVSVTHDLNREIADSTRKKREVNTLVIFASSGLEGSRNASVVVDIDVDRTCQGCEMQYIVKEPQTDGASMTVIIVVVVLVAVIAIVLLVIIAVILVRRRKQGKTPPPSETPMCDNDEFDTLPHPHATGPPVYGDVIRYQGKFGGNVTTSSDVSGHSHNSGSSGRGSAEDDEDEELAMINSSSPNYLNNSNGFRKNMPDSGIQDDDNTSEPSVQNHQDYLARLGIDTAKINSKAKLTHSVESMHQFSDSGGGEGVGLEIDNIDYTKMQGSQIPHENLMDKNNDMGFHEPEPHMAGSLSNVINSEEEYSGSYNWDYLLDWGPQYQPLAHVFSEIARLKDDTLQPKKQAVQIVPQRQLSVNSQQQVRMVPPPMITNAPPKAVTQPVSRSNRSSHSSNMNSRNSTINTSLPSMPRSPISHESSFTSPALTPSFTPSLSPLATRSPSVSPVNSGRGMVSNHSSGQTTPRSRNMNLNNNNKFVFSSSSSEQELRI